MAYDEEAVASAILSALSTNMGTVLASIKAEKGDGVTVPTPKLYYPSEQMEIPDLSASNPVITAMIESGKSIRVGDNAPRFFGGIREFDLSALLTLGIVNNDETTLQTYCYRLSRAISSIIWNNSQSGLRALDATVMDETRDRTEMLGAEAGGFMKITHFNFTIRYKEGF